MPNEKIKFNQEQQQAIEHEYNKNLILSAGAGSGKTKTLSEKVYQTISSGVIKPSELLVLTFTNNAAYEMKSRIIQKFKDENSPLANEIISAHIQTFDSFSSYLVKTYAHKLNMSESFNILDKAVFDVKIRELLDQILDEYYQDDIKRNRLVKTIKKFSLFKDDEIKNIIITLFNKLTSLSEEKQKVFIDNCLSHYYTTTYFNKCFNEYIDIYKKEMENLIFKAYIIDKFSRYKDLTTLSDNDIETINDIDINILSFSNEKLQSIYLAYRELLNTEKCEDFLQKAYNLKKEYAEYFPKTTPKNWFMEDDMWSPKVLEIFRQIAPGASSLLSPFFKGFNYKQEEFKHLYFKDDVALFIEIVLKLQYELNQYKRMCNTYTYLDINIMALSLLKKGDDVSKEILSRFKYVMVDEYQDTNHIKEEFIDAFISSGYSSLFCVGDAKQSIYGFTGSDVSLFQNRKNNTEKIDMNKNYRSGKPLIDDINYICSRYLTLEKGGIDYQDPIEQLQYDEKENIYGLPYDGFGVKRIVSTSEHFDDRKENKKWELQAIIEDIHKKIKSGYMVYERGKGIREVQYKDFVILTRTKKSFGQYLKAFVKEDIPLNIIESTNLREVDAIIVIQSLLSLIAYFMGNLSLKENQIKHYYYSVARSFLYEKQDPYIYGIITNTIEELLNDPIMVDISSFAEKEKECSFSQLFLDMLETFKIIKKLYLIGAVRDNINKIESLYSIILNKEQTGEGMMDFIELFNEINKYDISFTADSLTNTEDAVTIMTVHASKGLENKIVYLPNSQNKMSTGNNLKVIDINEKYGLILPYYNFKADDLDEDGNIKPININTITQRIVDIDKSEKNQELSEHRRLYYVALTRAENTVYIVGDEDSVSKNVKSPEGIYELLNCCPHYYEINPIIIESSLAKGVINKNDVSEYEESIKQVREYTFIPKILNNKVREKILNDLIDEKKDELINVQLGKVLNIFIKVMDYYKNEYLNDEDESIACKVFARIHNFKCDNFEDLAKIWPEKMYYGDKVEPMSSHILAIEADQIKMRFINEFDPTNIEISDLFENKTIDLETDKIDLISIFNGLAYAIDNVDSTIYISYQNKDYQDSKEHYQYIDRQYADSSSFKKYIYPTTNDDEIKFSKRIKSRASKIQLVDEEMPIEEVLERGSYLHRLLELTDLISKDTSFIVNIDDRKIIDKVLTNPIFDLLKDAKIYKEYGYYDEEFSTNGFIDLFFIKGDEYYIVDYKSKHVKDDAYDFQLHTYQRNIERIFNIKNKDKIHLFLVSILDNKILEVLPE